MQKQAFFKVKGMNRDLSVSAFSSEFAYENKNLRITASEDNTLMSLTNIRGTKDSEITLSGTPIGQAVIDNIWVIFTTSNSEDNSKKDKIYRVEIDKEDRIKYVVLYQGNLSFSTKNPIETLTYYENSKIKKVYWTDGNNQGRVINIEADEDTRLTWNERSFDFIPDLKLEEEVSITKEFFGGLFPAGTIQYVFTYFNSYGQESNIFHTSPIYYTSNRDRGESPETNVNNSFNIKISNIDTAFDYVRIYSILRTSINSTPEVKVVTDLYVKGYLNVRATNSYSSLGQADTIYLVSRNNNEEIPLSSLSFDEYREVRGSEYSTIIISRGHNFITLQENNIIKVSKTSTGLVFRDENTEFEVHSKNSNELIYTDTGTTGYSIDPTILLYVGGEEVIFGTMAQKDNTLFLGNIEVKNQVLEDNIIDSFKKTDDNDIIFEVEEKLEPPVAQDYYPYKNQLYKNSSQIKTFKYLEWYRFGVQLQHESGKWSNPIWVGDKRNTTPISSTFYNEDNIKLPVAKYTYNNKEIIESLVKKGYKRIRPVIVYPSFNDREAICQGVLCPTVYNVGDRYEGTPFVQSSWFTRPNIPFDIIKTRGKRIYALRISIPISDENFDAGGTFVINGIKYKKYDIVTNEEDTTYVILNIFKVDNPYEDKDAPPEGSGNFYLEGNESISFGYEYNKESAYWEEFFNPTDTRAKVLNNDIVNKGAWAEFRHNRPIPNNNQRNAEIQCIWKALETPYVNNGESDKNWVEDNSSSYYIDQSIITLHSPDIEFDESLKVMDTSGLQLRIVGMVPMTSFNSDVDIQTSTPAHHTTSKVPSGFYKEYINTPNNFSGSSLDSMFGFRGMIAGSFWFDVPTSSTSNTTGFAVYPWHRNGSLNYVKSIDNNSYRSAMLDKKRMSNLRYSYKSIYHSSEEGMWKSYDDSEYYKETRTGVSGIAIFNSNEETLVKIPAQKLGLRDIYYYGNIDKVLYSTDFEGYPIMYSNSALDLQNENPTKYNDNTSILEWQEGLFRGRFKEYDNYRGVDPIRIRYKSTPHAVIALNYTKDNYQRILPTLKECDLLNGEVANTWWSINHIDDNDKEGSTLYNKHMFWDSDKNTVGVQQDVISPEAFGYIPNIGGLQHGWLWLGELYRESVPNRFGGDTQEALENNEWVSCGKSTSLIDNNIAKESLEIKWEEGDTYYQRYDHIKTYPYSLEEQNAMTDIVSFMCETRINIDGRYDRNRGLNSNFTITPENFNIINEVYSQPNNFFVYRALNTNRISLKDYPNTITWTKAKTSGELIDNWTNITLASVLDLDGNKGKISALRNYNNNIIAFQDSGISQILYNETMQIASTEGVPIEIANSGKVTGKRYISDQIGCYNKWSIQESPYGIYFIDNINKGIFLFNGQLDNISSKLGFNSWINKVDINIWNPVEFDSIVTYYDANNKEVLFVNNEECLVYSEMLGQFTSFYNYEGIPYFTNINSNLLSLQHNKEDGSTKVWINNKGDYNNLYGTHPGFYTTIIVNPEPTKDKIFNTLEFRSDVQSSDGTYLNEEKPFNELTVWNEYQNGTTKLENKPYMPSNLRKKFRIWRANIPRDSYNNRDRIRNPWTYIKLSMNTDSNYKTILHDITVHYFEQ